MRKVSYEDYLKLEGLLALAHSHSRQLKHIEKAIVEVLNEKEDENCDGYYGHVSDFVYDSNYRTGKELLKNLNIKLIGEIEE